MLKYKIDKSNSCMLIISVLKIHVSEKCLLSVDIQKGREDNAFMPYSSGQLYLLSVRAAGSASAFCSWDCIFLSMRARLSMQDC